MIDAVLDLFAEESLTPTAAAVAERSCVSLRSVYRYFEDTDELVRAAIERSLERVRPLFEIEALGEGPLDDRIDRMVLRRLELYEQFAPMMRATVVQARTNPALAAQHDANRSALGRQVAAMFAPELARLDAVARSEVAAALDVVLSFESVEQLRGRRGLTLAETQQVIRRAVTSLLVAV